MLLERTRQTAAKEVAALLAKLLPGKSLYGLADELVACTDRDWDWAQAILHELVEVRPDVVPSERGEI